MSRDVHRTTPSTRWGRGAPPLRLLPSLLAAAGDVIYTIDTDGCCTWASPAVCDLLGCAPGDLRGARLLDWVLPSWRRRVAAFYIRQTRERTPQTTLEFPIVTRAGEERWIRQTALLLDEAGTAAGLIVIAREITRYMQAEIALQSKWSNLLALMNNLQDAVWSLDTDYRVLAWNETFAARIQSVYGVELKLGMNLLEFAWPEQQQVWRQMYDRVFSGESFTVEMEYRGVGLPAATEILFTPIYNQGQVIGATVLSRDVSQRKLAERALRESEERYRSVVDQAIDLIFSLDTEARITSLNPAFEAITGWRVQDWIGRSFVDMLNTEDLSQAMTFFHSALRQEQIPPFEMRVRTAWGGFVVGEFKINPQVTDGRVVSILGIARDVTERKRAETERDHYIHQLEILQQVDTELSQNLQVDYVLTMALDAAVRLSKADAGAIHLLEPDGRLRVAQVIGDYPRELVGSYVPLNQGIVGRVLRTQQPELVTDVTQDPDYVDHVLDTRAQITIPLLSRDRLIGTINVQTSKPELFTRRNFDFLKLLGARIAASIDNAALYQTSQAQLAELRSLYQQVSALERLKTDMIRIASHDLRNPLGIVSGYIQMLEWDLEETEGHMTDRRREHLKIIKDATARIDKITKDILTLERIEGIVKGTLYETVSLCEVVRDVFEECRSEAIDKRLDYELALPDQPLAVRGDQVFLRESVANLLNNAIKYTPAGGAVHVRLGVGEGCAIFEVEDTGYGIPPEHQEGLFQPFYRANTKETKAIRGTGLGLHLVKQIIERHHGHIRFHSVYGQGSTFGFELPLLNGSASDPQPRQTAEAG